MEFGGGENWKDFMALAVLRFVVYRKTAVSRVANSFSCQTRYHCYHFRNDRALMNESNSEMHQGHNLRWETGFSCTKPLPHPELLILLQTRDIFLLPGPPGQSLQNFGRMIFQSLCRSLSLWSEGLCPQSETERLDSQMRNGWRTVSRQQGCQWVAGDTEETLRIAVYLIGGPWGRLWGKGETESGLFRNSIFF